MIAALYVETNGVYFNLPDVDPWDVKRDARLYAGPYPVVAHPPCNRWCAGLSDVNQARYGHKVGDDGGTFAAALAAVRTCGGVLEHPARTHAWKAHGLMKPTKAGWSRAPCGGWVCELSQCAYGHPARKLTWLYAVAPTEPMPMDWSRPAPTACISYDAKYPSKLPSIFGKKNSRTPLSFRDALISIASRCATPSHRHPVALT